MSHVVREVWHVCPSHGCDYKAKHSGNLSKHLANFPHSSSETTAGITLDPLSIDSDSIGIDSIDLDDPPPTADHYRADIDGLRCIAVLLVIAFHAYPSFCPGGFIGVDMFFVISGYLITSILSRQIISAKPPFRRLDFFSRRIRRIFPTLLCTILFTILASRLILTPTDFRALGTMAAFSAAFCANINAARKLSTTTTATDYDYFDTVDTTEASASDPLLHLWSLGLEEQFYLVWPLLLPPLLSLPPTRLLWSFLALTLSSFFINLLVVYSPDYSAYAYYLPVTRFWEIWVGAFVVWQPKPQPHPTQLAFVGLTLLITSLIIIDSTTLFPAWATILPTVGTAAVIAAGPDTIVNRALANKLCVAVGLISYPLYLFHWPCLVLSRVADAAASPAIALAISLALTLLTFFLVEQPLRHRKSPRTPLILALAMTLLFILCVAISQELGFSGAPSPPAPWEPLLTNNSSNASRVFDKCLAQVSTATVAAATSMPGGWNYDVESSPYECYKKASPGSFFHMKVCELNPGSTNEAVIIVGDSHAEQWHARYDYLIRNNLTDANVVLISTSGCTALPLRKPVDITFDRKSTGEHHCCSCGNSTEAMLDVARQWRDEHAGGVRAIVWAAYWEYELVNMRWTDSQEPAEWPNDDTIERWQTAVTEFVDAGVIVYVVDPAPIWKTAWGKSGWKRGWGLENHQWWFQNVKGGPKRLVGEDRELVDDLEVLKPFNVSDFRASTSYVVRPLLDAAEEVGAVVLYPDSTICLDGLCPTIDPAGWPALKDGDHYRWGFVEVYGGFLDVTVGLEVSNSPGEYCV